MASPYPVVNFRFGVAVDSTGNDDAGFAEVSGLDGEIGTEAIEEGGENRFAHIVPTRGTHGNLVLKRGILDKKAALFQWCKSAMEDGLAKRLAPRKITVSLLDSDSTPLLTWNFADCWPVKMQVAPLDAKTGDVAIETMEFVYAFMTRDYG